MDGACEGRNGQGTRQTSWLHPVGPLGQRVPGGTGGPPSLGLCPPLQDVKVCAQAWKPSSQHAGEKRGVAGLLLGRTERAARAAELQLCAQAR